MRDRCYRQSVKVNPFPTLYFFYKIQMIVSESNDFNIVAALCSPVFWLLEEKVVCLCPSLHSGAGFVVAQEEISRERARRKGEEASAPTRVITSHGLKKYKCRLLRVTKS